MYLIVGDHETFEPQDGIFGALVQYPSTDGRVLDYRNFTARVKTLGAMVIAATDLLALTMLTPPGEWGADVAIGNSQRFVYHWGSVGRTQLSWLLESLSRESFQGVSSGFRLTKLETQRFAWLSRRASSTFVEKRLRLIFVRRRYYWPSWLPLLGSTMDLLVSERLQRRLEGSLGL